VAYDIFSIFLQAYYLVQKGKHLTSYSYLIMFYYRSLLKS
jgi:hypothetical protein